MSPQQQTDYTRIAEAIDYIRTQYKDQPSLEDVAAQVHLSPAHFQRLFSDWAGVSPKQFLQYISIGHARKLLDAQATIFDAASETGLSGSSRLHDLFLKIDGMTPGEYKNGGAELDIDYTLQNTPFGNVFIANTPKGICHISFADSEAEGLEAIQARFPNARYIRRDTDMQAQALRIFNHDWQALPEIKLHLKGTPFQIKVWEALLKIPTGALTTYGSIAGWLGQPTASRAVGSAVGDNPIAFLIPCHRVIQSTGQFGQYMWGSTRKTAMIGWEAAHTR